MMKDELGKRMKEFYENRTRILLPRRTYTIIRIDGKAFHTYTSGLNEPFDEGLINDMDETACYLCKNIQGAKFGFVQSDEISILVTDFEKITTDAWFDGNIQKIVSISASMATSRFNHLRIKRIIDESVRVEGNSVLVKPYTNDILEIKLAEFDARTFTIPSKVEVENYFIWRQQDTVRNSISSVAQYHYSHNELRYKSTNQMQEMIFEKGQNWNDYPVKHKRGRFIEKQMYDKDGAVRSKWISVDCPTFTQDREFLSTRIPDLL